MNVKNLDELAVPSNGATAQKAGSVSTSNPTFTIVTHRNIDASPERVWSSLRFYEDLEQKTPFLLRLMLPRPLPATALMRAEGDETTLRYEDGHYAKRVSKLEPEHHYEFDVIDQRLASDRGVTLLSGAYTLRELSDKQTDLAITTRYASRIGPRWIAKPMETFLCRRLHKHLLDAIQTQAEH
jgi:uncharacterized protein YndB with AHSA1/START domain